jgi:hypothetical protein
MTIVKFSPLSSSCQKGVTIAKIRIPKLGSLKLGSQSGWIAKIGIPANWDGLLKIRIPILGILILATMKLWNLRICIFKK